MHSISSNANGLHTIITEVYQQYILLKREEIQNITVLTVKDKKEAGFSKKNGKSFQSASIIVMRKAFPDGYLLKKDFNVYDEDATFIEVNLPNKKLDLSAIEFEMKYPRPRKLKQDKLDDLQKMRPFLDNDGVWIDKLLEEQKKNHMHKLMKKLIHSFQLKLWE